MDLESIEVPVWWSNGGGMSYRRDSLEHDHPEHTYNYVKRTYGVDPKLFGIAKPFDPISERDRRLLADEWAKASGWL